MSRKERMRKQPQPSIPLKEGDTVDIIPLLFPQHRPFLLKSNSDQLVKAEDLRGRLIVLFFSNIYPSQWVTDSFCLLEVYNKIHHTSPFEVVFIPVTFPRDLEDPKFDPKRAFHHMFPTCRGLVVSRQHLQEIFGFNGTVCPDTPVIDPTGLILAVYGQSLFSSLGARGYPYTDQRIKFLVAEENALLENPSIYNLLTSPERDYVISNDGLQLPILSLEHKVVALHFLEEGHSIHVRPDCSYDDLTAQLMTTYELFKDKNFEVVLVYIHDSWNTQGRTNEYTFWKTFKTMPWLALPFKDPVIKKLMRICNYPVDLEGPAPDPGLVIIGPRGEFFEPYGADILMNFGNKAYPFTRRKMVNLEAEKAREVKPYMFWDSNTLFIQNADFEVPFSKVAGKRIILLIGECMINDAKSLTVLKSEYNRRKGTDDEFEVIQVLDSEMQYDDSERVEDAPWLIHLFDEDSPRLPELLRGAFGNALLVAFDSHGQVLRKASYLDIESREDSKFPFYGEHEIDPKFLTWSRKFIVICTPSSIGGIGAMILFSK